MTPEVWLDRTECSSEDCVATIIRADTGKCEHCTAKAWWREQGERRGRQWRREART